MPISLAAWVRSNVGRYGDPVAAARAHQIDGWTAGRPVPAEDYLAALPVASAEDRLVVVMGEVEARLERGERPALDEYRARFPALADGLAIQFALLAHLAAERDAPDVPGYELGDEIGRGSAAAVYRATRRATGGLVALKILHPFVGDDPVARVRFLREAEVLAGFDHPGIVRVSDFGAAGDRLYLAMELVPGGSLAAAPPGAAADPAVTGALVAALADALQYAHERGVGHRDVKPANVLIDAAGRPKLTDFGLAKTFGVDGLTTTHRFVGTPAYAAPEQVAGRAFAYAAPEQAASGRTVGPAADIYALGVLLYERLTGRLPHLGETVHDTLRNKLADAPPDPRAIRPAVPKALAAVCRRCLAVSPADRFATAAELAAAVRSAVGGSRSLWGRLFRPADG